MLCLGMPRNMRLTFADHESIATLEIIFRFDHRTTHGAASSCFIIYFRVKQSINSQSGLVLQQTHGQFTAPNRSGWQFHSEAFPHVSTHHFNPLSSQENYS